MSETAVVFQCKNDPLVGIIHAPEISSQLGIVVIVAGGPQFRVGAHRQFIALARRLVCQGYPVIRFDHRGTGDSGGEVRGFLDMAEDIQAAIDVLIENCPGVKKVVLWGECESASAAAFYAHSDPRVAGIFMVNPWIRTEAGQAKTYLKHYYWQRLRDPKFWEKVRSMKFSPIRSIRAWFGLVASAWASSRASKTHIAQEQLSSLPLPERLTKSLKLFQENMFILTSGKDYIAQEFKDFTASSPMWNNSGLDERIVYRDMKEADHTFSRAEWREQMFVYTEDWLGDLEPNISADSNTITQVIDPTRIQVTNR